MRLVGHGIFIKCCRHRVISTHQVVFMLPHKMHPSTRPVAQRVQLMVSNFFEVLEDESSEEDCAIERARNEHPEVVAPHTPSECNEVVAPHPDCRVFHTASCYVSSYDEEPIDLVFSDILIKNQPFCSGNYSYVNRNAIKSLDTEEASGMVQRSFVDCAFRGEFSVGSEVLLSKYFKAGITENLALNVLSSVASYQSKTEVDDVYRVINGEWWRTITSYCYVKRRYNGRFTIDINKPFIDRISRKSDGCNLVNASISDGFYYQLSPWLSDCIKEGSFNPYGNGQFDCSHWDVDNWDDCDGSRSHSTESDPDLVDRILDEDASAKVKHILHCKVIAPVTDYDQTLSAVRALTPVCTLFYQLYSARTKTDAIVAAWSYMERMAVEDDYVTVKVGLGWASSFISQYRPIIETHLNNAYEFFRSNLPKIDDFKASRLQSSDSVSDMIDFLTQITVGVQTNARAQSFIWLIAFVFTSITAARSGVFISFTEYSKRSKEMVDRCFILGSAGVTVSLFITAVRNCYDMVSELSTQGLSSLWRGEIAMVSDLRVRGERLLERTLSIQIQSDFSEIISYGSDLDRFLREVEIHTPKLATRQLGINFFGIGMNSETNAAILWASIKKMTVELKNAYIRYKLMLVSITYRKAPFAMAAVGGSSLGKSLWTQAMASVINNYLGVKHDPSLIFTFNPATDYMDGYKPFQTIVVLDDVATMRPDYCKDGDPQVKAIIPMINNVAMLTPQADLPDKKTCPFVSQAVLLTSNTKDFNAHVYATNPAALLRRVKFRVILTVNGDFVNDTGGLDQVKARRWQESQVSGVTNFPPFWNYTVQEMIVVNGGSNASGFVMNTRDRDILRDASTSDYLNWFHGAWMDHQDNQSSALKQVESMCNLKVCVNCRLPHPYHKPDCVGNLVNGSVQSLDICGHSVDDTFLVCVSTVIALCCTWAFKALYRFIDGLLIVRDKSIRTMAVVEDAANNLSYMSGVWSRIGAPAALVLGTFGAIYSWVCVWISFSYFLFLNFPTTRVKAVLSTRNTMFAAVTMIAGGLMLKSLVGQKHARTNGATYQSKDDQVEDECGTCDFSVNDKAVRWGEGIQRPYEGEALVTAYSSATRTTCGGSQDGALVAIKKAIFVANISSVVGRDVRTSTCNGFVYSMNPPIIAVNSHSLTTHVGRGDLTFKLMFSPNNGQEAVNEEFRLAANVFIFSISQSLIATDSSRDLAMMFVKGLGRRGLSQYMVLDGHHNGGVGPQMIARNLRGSIIERHLGSYTSYGKLIIGSGSKVVELDRAYSYSVTNPTQDGESGALVVLHRGSTLFGEKGGVAVAGFHVAINSTNSHVICAPLDAKVCTTLADSAHSMYLAFVKMGVGDVTDAALQCLQHFTPVGTEDNVFDLDKGSIGGKLGSVHYKSAINWLEVDNGAVQVFGSIAGDSRTTQGLRSQYKATRWSAGLSVTDSVLGDTSNKYMPTVVDPKSLWQVHHATLRDLLSISLTSIPDLVLNNAVVGFVEDIIDGVSRSGNSSRWKNFGVLTLAESINGIDGVLDSIVWKTGGGFGYTGAKHNRRQVVENFVPGLNKSGIHYTLDDDVMDSIYKADDLLRRGIDPGFVYQTHLKDEVRTVSKVMNCQIRMICGAPIPAIVLTRKYLASLIIFMSQNPLITECAVGMNSECRQWGDLARYLIDYGGTNRFIAGDYSNFDKNQTLQMTLAVSQVMLALVSHAQSLHPEKYNSGDILAIKTLLSGLCYPRYDHFGTLLSVCGTNPSGNSLTAQRNCVANSLYVRCSFIMLSRNCIGLDEKLSRRLFSRVVRQINYGDDVVLAIRDGFHWFNHDTVTYALSQWGVPFTHADKSVGTGRPYDEFSNVTFLKRAFVYNDEIGDYLAPLDLSSVVKGLHYYNPSGSPDYNSAHAILLRSQVENVLSHGRTVYDSFCAEAVGLARLAGLSGLDFVEATTYPSWDDFILRWNEKSTNPKFTTFPTYPEPPRYPLLDILGDLGALV